MIHNTIPSRPSRTTGLAVAAIFLLFVGLGVFAYFSEKSQSAATAETGVTLLNVSYDATRELYCEINHAFSRDWQEKTGERIVVRMSNGGSGSQAQAVIGGLPADVVTLALSLDIDDIAEHTDLLPRNWKTRLPNNSAPYTSTLAFLVRKGNPKQIRDWHDLVRPDVRVMTPDPKTSGVARWTYLALWGYALRRELGSDFASLLSDPRQADNVQAAQTKAREFVAAVYRNVPVLDESAREATNHFIRQRIGDVLINWENEILLGGREFDRERLEIIVPPVSILTEPVIALVDGNVDRRGTRPVAETYLEFLYSEIGQDIIGRNFYRPAVSERAQIKYRDQFPAIEMFTVDAVFGSWSAAYRTHFTDGGTFDQIFRPRS